jgi:hypothetical protein
MAVPATKEGRSASPAVGPTGLGPANVHRESPLGTMPCAGRARAAGIPGVGSDRRRAPPPAGAGRVRRLFQSVASSSGVGPTGAVRIGAVVPVQPDRPDHWSAGPGGLAPCVSPCSLMVGRSCCALQGFCATTTTPLEKRGLSFRTLRALLDRRHPRRRPPRPGPSPPLIRPSVQPPPRRGRLAWIGERRQELSALLPVRVAEEVADLPAGVLQAAKQPLTEPLGALVEPFAGSIRIPAEA